MKLLDWAFCIFPITLDRVNANIDPTIKRSQIEASIRITYFFRKISGGFGENLKKTRGSN